MICTLMALTYLFRNDFRASFQTVEIVLIDQSTYVKVIHPFHLHGHAFRILAQKKLGDSTTKEKVMNLDKGKRSRPSTQSLKDLGRIYKHFDGPLETRVQISGNFISSCMMFHHVICSIDNSCCYEIIEC